MLVLVRGWLISYRFLSSLERSGYFVFGGKIWHFQTRRWRNLAEALSNIQNKGSLIRTSQVCNRRLAIGRSQQVKKYKQTHTHTHTHTHTRARARTMYLSNNCASFHLWWKENLVKHQKVSKYYENDCCFSSGVPCSTRDISVQE